MRIAEDLRRHVLPEADMVRDHLLVHNVVAVQADLARLDLRDCSLLSGRQPTQVGHPQFDYKSASGRQVAGSVAEAGNLL